MCSNSRETVEIPTYSSGKPAGNFTIYIVADRPNRIHGYIAKMAITELECPTNKVKLQLYIPQPFGQGWQMTLRLNRDRVEFALCPSCKSRQSTENVWRRTISVAEA